MRYFAAFAAILGAVAAAPFSASAIRRESQGSMQVKLVNTLGRPINYYITGQVGNDMQFVQPDGKLADVSGMNKGQNVKDGAKKISTAIKHVLPKNGDTITIPYLNSGRIYFVDGADLDFNTVAGADGAVSLADPSVVNGADPASKINWGFIEFTFGKDGSGKDNVYANISYVDWVGLPIGLKLDAASGVSTSVAGLKQGAIDKICAELAAINEGHHWEQLCVKDAQGKNLRILSPGDYIGTNSNAFAGYWVPLANSVWDWYSKPGNTLQIDTKQGPVTCTSNGDVMTCKGAQSTRAFSTPNEVDVWGCNSGPFQKQDSDDEQMKFVLSTLCANFHRGTWFSAAKSFPAPSTLFWSNKAGATENAKVMVPYNQYAKVVHENEPDNKGYTFAFDDNTREGDADSSGFVNDVPKLLTITVGGGQ